MKNAKTIRLQTRNGLFILFAVGDVVSFKNDCEEIGEIVKVGYDSVTVTTDSCWGTEETTLFAGEIFEKKS